MKSHCTENCSNMSALLKIKFIQVYYLIDYLVSIFIVLVFWSHDTLSLSLSLSLSVFSVGKDAT